MNKSLSFRPTEKNSLLLNNSKNKTKVINNSLLLYKLLSDQIGQEVLDGFLSNSTLLELTVDLNSKSNYVNLKDRNTDDSIEIDSINNETKSICTDIDLINKEKDVKDGVAKALLMKSSLYK